jgi:hypothetical protein
MVEFQQAGDFFEKRPRPAILKTAVILAQIAMGLEGFARIDLVVLF